VLKKQTKARPVKKTTQAPVSKPVKTPVKTQVKTQVSQSPPVPAVKVEPNKPKAAPAPVVPAVPDPAIERQQLREQTQRQQQQDMQRAMAEEELMMQAEEDELLADSYAALIKRTVEGYWSRPPSARKDMQVILSIRLIPTGEVVGVEVTQSSGNLAFDRSALNAVEKAARFPELKDMQPSVFEAYFRRFSLVFKPEDLLL
jgi:colicin import membrane protein